MDSDKLTTPAQDNAYLYYQEVIKLAPDHEGAQQGLMEIANRYADLTEQAFDRFDYVNANYYVREGLSVWLENPRLMALKKRSNAVKDIPNRIIKEIKSVFR